MLIELRCVTRGGAREEVVPGNLNSEPSRVNSIWPSQYFRAQLNSFARLLESKWALAFTARRKVGNDVLGQGFACRLRPYSKACVGLSPDSELLTPLKWISAFKFKPRATQVCREGNHQSSHHPQNAVWPSGLRDEARDSRVEICIFCVVWRMRHVTTYDRTECTSTSTKL